MKFPLLTIFLLFLAWFTYNRIRVTKRERAEAEAFWNKEEEANTIRRQDISSLPYIKIPLDELPLGICPQDPALSQCEETITTLSQVQILNLTGLTNTQLKLEYGAANLAFLSQCDLHFTELVRTMDQWGTRLTELDHIQEAIQVLFQAVRWGSDLKSTYLLLGQLCQASGLTKELGQLTDYASSLNSLRRNSILSALDAFKA